MKNIHSAKLFRSQHSFPVHDLPSILTCCCILIWVTRWVRLVELDAVYPSEAHEFNAAQSLVFCGFELTMLVVIGTDCIGSCKSDSLLCNYLTVKKYIYFYIGDSSRRRATFVTCFGGSSQHYGTESSRYSTSILTNTQHHCYRKELYDHFPSTNRYVTSYC